MLRRKPHLEQENQQVTAPTEQERQGGATQVHHPSFLHFAEHFWYGWWPYVPLTLVIAVVFATVLARIAWTNQKYDAASRRWVPVRWRFPTAVLTFVFGFLLWPLAIIICGLLFILGTGLATALADER